MDIMKTTRRAALGLGRGLGGGFGLGLEPVAQGLAMGTASAPVQPEQSGHGIGQHFGLYPLLYKASNVKEALDELSNYNFAGKGLIFGPLFISISRKSSGGNAIPPVFIAYRSGSLIRG